VTTAQQHALVRLRLREAQATIRVLRTDIRNLLKLIGEEMKFWEGVVFIVSWLFIVVGGLFFFASGLELNGTLFASLALLGSGLCAIGIADLADW